MDGIENESSVFSQYLAFLQNMAAHFFGCCIRQDTLGIDTATPESDLAAVFLFQDHRVHILRINLYRVDDIETRLHQTGKNRQVVCW